MPKTTAVDPDLARRALVGNVRPPGPDGVRRLLALLVPAAEAANAVDESDAA